MSNGGCLGNVKCVYVGFVMSMCVCFFGYKLNLEGINCEFCINNNCYIYCQFVDDNEFKSVISFQIYVEV